MLFRVTVLYHHILLFNVSTAFSHFSSCIIISISLHFQTKIQAQYWSAVVLLHNIPFLFCFQSLVMILTGDFLSHLDTVCFSVLSSSVYISLTEFISPWLRLLCQYWSAARTEWVVAPRKLTNNLPIGLFTNWTHCFVNSMNAEYFCTETVEVTVPPNPM